MIRNLGDDAVRAFDMMLPFSEPTDTRIRVASGTGHARYNRVEAGSKLEVTNHIFQRSKGASYSTVSAQIERTTSRDTRPGTRRNHMLNDQPDHGLACRDGLPCTFVISLPRPGAWKSNGMKPRG